MGDRILPFLSAVCLATLPLAAQTRGGVQLALVQPLASTKHYNSTGGPAVSLFAEVPFSQGQSLRPRLELSKQGTQEMEGFRTKVAHTFLGADYVVHVQDSRQGLSVFLGAGLCKSTLDFAMVEFYQRSESRTRSAFTAGFGWDFNRRWGLEARVTQADFGITLSWYQLGVNLRL